MNKIKLSDSIFKYTLILIDSGLALWMYVNPSLKYAGSSILDQIVLVSCSLLANFFVIFWTAEAAFEYAKNQKSQSGIATEIIGYTPSFSNQIAKYIWITLGAISSVGAAAIVLQEAAGSESSKIMQAIGVFAANLPLNMYGALELYREHGEDILNVFRRGYKIFLSTSSIFTNKTFALKQTLQILLIKKKLLTIIQAASNQLVASKNELDFKIDLKQPPFWNKIFSYTQNLTEQKQKKTTANLRILFGICGALICEVSAFGYVMSTKRLADAIIFNNFVSIAATIFISTISSYLNALFGYKTFVGIWDITFSFRKKCFYKPLAFLLYPKLTSLLMIATIGISIFSYATFTQLIIDNFHGMTANILVETSKISVAIFNGYCSVQLVKYFVELFALRFGDPQQQKQVALNFAMKNLASDIKTLEGQPFLNFLLSTLPQENINQLLVISDIAPNDFYSINKA